MDVKGSKELTERLRAILAKGFSADELKHVASHSLKATLLAYMNVWDATWLSLNC